MTERARAAYAAYGECLGWKTPRGIAIPQFSELPETVQKAWDSVCDGVLRHWLEHEFKMALKDDSRVELKAVWMLKIGHANGDSAVQNVRVALASFVVDCIAPNWNPPS